MPYQAAIGWDNAAGLVDLTPQPASPSGFQFASRSHAAAGDSYHEGEMVMDLTYTLNEDRATLETQLGVSITVASSKVTLRLPDNNYQWGNYNCWVEYPQGGTRFNSQSWNQVVYRVRVKEAL